MTSDKPLSEKVQGDVYNYTHPMIKAEDVAEAVKRLKVIIGCKHRKERDWCLGCHNNHKINEIFGEFEDETKI